VIHMDASGPGSDEDLSSRCESNPTEANSVPERVETDTLSTFRTRHVFEHLGTFRSPEEFLRLRSWAKERRLPVCVVGKGSNLLFCRRRIRAVVLLNQLPKKIIPLAEDLFRVSTSVSLGEVLRMCRAQSRESFYYLASVPASVGGALAMNAGRGESFHQTIYDFVQSVTILNGDQPQTLRREDIPVRHRWTPFREQTETLLLAAVFRFPLTQLSGDPIAERLAYCREIQDPTAPNCGSAFSHCSSGIMRRLMGRRVLGAQWSAKTQNWILNHSKSSLGIRLLLLVARVLHFVRGRRCQVEFVQIR
jgi:UDP-N-acetylmuramate dehydrogenase